jgi:hypothetical protein
MNEDRYRFEAEDRAVQAYEPSEQDLAEMEAYYGERDAAYDREAMIDQMYVEALRDLKTGEALAFLVDLHGGDDCGGEVPAPVEVLEVLDTNGQSYIRARVRCADGTVRVALASIRHYPGNRECPPDVDVNYHYEEVAA